jgi:hypothetical protein
MSIRGSAGKSGGKKKPTVQPTVQEPAALPVNQPAQIIGESLVSASSRVDDQDLDVQVSIHREPEEDILLLGLMMQDCALQAEMLRDLIKAGNVQNYRSSLMICRGAAVRMKQRCTRLLGDGDVLENGTRVSGNGTTPGTANGAPRSSRRSPEAKK